MIGFPKYPWTMIGFPKYPLDYDWVPLVAWAALSLPFSPVLSSRISLVFSLGCLWFGLVMNNVLGLVNSITSSVMMSFVI